MELAWNDGKDRPDLVEAKRVAGVAAVNAFADRECGVKLADLSTATRQHAGYFLDGL